MVGGVTPVTAVSITTFEVHETGGGLAIPLITVGPPTSPRAVLLVPQGPVLQVIGGTFEQCAQTVRSKG